VSHLVRDPVGGAASKATPKVLHQGAPEPWWLGACRLVPGYVAPIRDTDTPIPIRRYVDTVFSKNKDTPIRQVYKYIKNQNTTS
jgi:hypothetical protein